MRLLSPILNHNILELGSIASKFVKPKSFFIKGKSFQRCLLTNNTNNYVWTHIRPPTENQKLFEVLVGSANSKESMTSNLLHNKESLSHGNTFLVDSNCSNLLEKPDRADNVEEIRKQFFKIIEKNEPDCLRKLSILVRKHFCDLIPIKAPFDSHWAFIKKLDKCLVNYCKGLRKDVWMKPEFIDECLRLTVDLYEVSPPTAMFYYDQMVVNILGKAPKLTIGQFLQLMFCCIITRQRMDRSKINWCQDFIKKNLDSLNLAQLSLILVAFHKTKSHLTDEHLLMKILVKAGAEAQSEPDTTIRSSLLKGINYSLVMPNNKLSTSFIDSFFALDNLSVYNYIHLCEYCVNKKFYCPKLIDSSLNVLQKAIEHLREKDVERILKCATAFDHLQPPCPDIYKMIHQLDSTFRQSEPVELEKTIPSLLRSCFLLDIYPPNMIDFILTTDWTKKINFVSSDIHLYYWLLMTVRDCLMIDKHPEYVGRLNNLDLVYNRGIRNRGLRIPTQQIAYPNENEKINMNTRNFAQLYKAALDAFPNRFVRLGYFLSTSLTPDLMISSVEKHTRLLKGPIRTPNSFTKAYVLVYQAKQTYIDNNYSQISGHHRLREKLFKKLGLTVINIPFFEIYHKTDEDGDNTDLVNYVKERINELES